jgi:hypothetical protein
VRVPVSRSRHIGQVDVVGLEEGGGSSLLRTAATLLFSRFAVSARSPSHGGWCASWKSRVSSTRSRVRVMASLPLCSRCQRPLRSLYALVGAGEAAVSSASSGDAVEAISLLNQVTRQTSAALRCHLGLCEGASLPQRGHEPVAYVIREDD